MGWRWRAGLPALAIVLAGGLPGAAPCLAQQPQPQRPGANPGGGTAASQPADPAQVRRPAPVGPAAPGAPGAPGQPAPATHPRPDAEDVLAMLVKRAGAIFAGEVYAIRMPGTESSPGTSGGGAPSPNTNAVEIEFRVDQPIRGASMGNAFVLREWPGLWQNRPAPFQLHQRGVFLLYPPNQAGLSSPVAGENGIFPVDGSYLVDLTRLHALEGKPGALAGGAAANGADGAPDGAPSGSNGAGGSPPANPAAIPEVTTTSGEQTLLAGADEGRMDDLEQKTVPFLAFLRDLFVLSAAEEGGPAGSTSDAPRHEKPAPASRPPR